ncbi:protein of unknown function [Cupriavidus neocaledonicus]|uniref:Uncharacterized protein n=1 Tax=Cupriavidus neocaledonicus TaxID=1040979 RepID=A0A375H558_9BURK|nr:exported hypothetical protein [Cupriavidus neocaledonicus]SPD46375.1 protein of unknown function [Cupriavidus neocaledonicus]
MGYFLISRSAPFLVVAIGALSLCRRCLRAAAPHGVQCANRYRPRHLLLSCRPSCGCSRMAARPGSPSRRREGHAARLWCRLRRCPDSMPNKALRKANGLKENPVDGRAAEPIPHGRK